MINIYTAESTASAVSTDDSAPLFTTHNKSRFHPDIRKLYVRNDDTSVWVSNLTIQATSTVSDMVSGSSYFGVKFYLGDLEPTDRVWNAISYNQEIRFQPIGTEGSANTSTFYPFWMRAEAAANSPVSVYKGHLVTSYVEHAA